MKRSALFASMIASGTIWANVSHAEEWTFVAESNTYRLAIDSDSINRHAALGDSQLPSGTVTGRVAQIFRENQQTDDGTSFRSIEWLAYVDCDQKRAKWTNMLFYDDQNNFIGSKREGENSWYQIRQQTPAQWTCKYLCAEVVCGTYSGSTSCSHNWQNYQC